MYGRALRDSAGLALLVGLCCELSAQVGTDLQGGTELTYELDLSRALDRAKVAKEVKELLSKRLEAYGLEGASIALQDDDRLRIRLPATDPQSISDLKDLLERGGTLDFHLVAADQAPALVDQYEKEWRTYVAKDREWVEKKRATPSLTERRPQPPKYIVRSEVEKAKEGNRERFVPKPNGKHILENLHTTYDETTQSWVSDGIVSGKYLDRADPAIEPGSLKPAVTFRFTGEGAAQLSRLTGNNKGRQLAIVLDDEILQIAVIREQIRSSGQLSGKFSDDDVKRLIAILRGGSLGARPKLISERRIEPAK